MSSLPKETELELPMKDDYGFFIKKLVDSSQTESPAQ
jgi:hypothetical protein